MVAPGPARRACAGILLLILLGAPLAAARTETTRVPGLGEGVAERGVVPCMDVGVSLLHYAYALEGRFPDVAPCSDSRIRFTWTSSARQGEGELQIDLVPDDKLWVLSDDVVLVEPWAPLGELLGLRGGVEAPSGEPPEKGRRIVVHVRFSATWMSPDCRDAAGEAAATANGARVHARPDASFFRSLCALSQTGPAGAVASGPLFALAAGALDAVARTSSEAWASDVLGLRDALARMGTAALPDPPAVGATRRPTSNATGDVQLEAAPEDGEVAVREEVAVAAVAVEARHEWETGLDVDASAPPRAVGPAVAWGPVVAEPGVPSGSAADEALPVRGRDLDVNAPAAPPAPSTAPPRIVPLVTLSSSAVPAHAGLARSAVAATALAAGVLLLAFALYQRIARHQALDHPAREALHAACIARGAPATTSELAGAAGLRPKTAEHHLRYLVRLGLLREDRAPDAPRRYAPPAAPSGQAPESVDERLLACVLERPGVSTSEAAKALRLAPLRADRRLKALVMRGLLESRVSGRARRFFPAREQPTD